MHGKMRIEHYMNIPWWLKWNPGDPLVGGNGCCEGLQFEVNIVCHAPIISSWPEVINSLLLSHLSWLSICGAPLTFIFNVGGVAGFTKLWIPILDPSDFGDGHINPENGFDGGVDGMRGCDEWICNGSLELLLSLELFVFVDRNTLFGNKFVPVVGWGGIDRFCVVGVTVCETVDDCLVLVDWSLWFDRFNGFDLGVVAIFCKCASSKF